VKIKYRERALHQVKMSVLKLLQFSAFLFTLFQSCHLQRRIYNGFEAKHKQFPYMAIVRGSLNCGGALVTEKYLIDLLSGN
jgi:hypothetical protein